MDGNKGWSSERVPIQSGGGSRRQISATTLTPFYTGNTMPSKWDDAERWICSPASGYSAAKNLNFQSQRLQKSKSGPIVPPGIRYYSNSSPVMQVLDGHRVRNSVVEESPFSTGVIVPGGVPLHYRGLVGNDDSFAQSTAPTRWADLASESSLPSSQGTVSFLASNTIAAKKEFPDVVDFNQNARSACVSSWETSETATNVSKLQREEAKITAWENLQQAKAEAAIRKLEIKMEKKRSSSMDKILNNLRVALMKAQQMRSSISDRRDNQSSKTCHKITFSSKHAKMSSLKSCFTCCYVL